MFSLVIIVYFVLIFPFVINVKLIVKNYKIDYIIKPFYLFILKNSRIKLKKLLSFNKSFRTNRVISIPKINITLNIFSDEYMSKVIYGALFNRLISFSDILIKGSNVKSKVNIYNINDKTSVQVNCFLCFNLISFILYILKFFMEKIVCHKKMITG